MKKRIETERTKDVEHSRQPRWRHSLRMHVANEKRTKDESRKTKLWRARPYAIRKILFRCAFFMVIACSFRAFFRPKRQASHERARTSAQWYIFANLTKWLPIKAHIFLPLGRARTGNGSVHRQRPIGCPVLVRNERYAFEKLNFTWANTCQLRVHIQRYGRQAGKNECLAASHVTDNHLFT